MRRVNRINKLDNVKWILTLLIVLYHIQYRCQTINNEKAFLYIKNLGDCVVPAFAIISGFLFFVNIENYSDLYIKIRKRIFTLLVPYLLWNLFHTLYINVFSLKGMNLSALDINIFTDVLQWNSSPHFWYIFMLIFWTILSPVLLFCYKNKIGRIVFFILQIIYLIFQGESIYHSRFVYILYTWAGFIGYKKYDLFENINKWSKRNKVIMCMVFGGIFLFLSLCINSFEISMQYKVWLYALKGLALIYVTYNLPDFFVGREIGYRYTFWIFAVHYWLDFYVGKFVAEYINNALLYQALTFLLVILIGALSGVIFSMVCPQLFNLFTGDRGVELAIWNKQMVREEKTDIHTNKGSEKDV